MPVPIVYRKAQENLIASYSFTDVATGTGYVEYFGSNVRISGANIAYRLSSNNFYSSDIATTASIPTQTLTKSIDIDFDVQFNFPQHVDGNLIANIPFAITNPTINKTYNAYSHLRIRKWDGTTETEIANTSGATITLSGGVSNSVYKMEALSIPLPHQHFKRGETLRATVEIYTFAPDASSNGNVFLFHDPKNRDATDVTGFANGNDTMSTLTIQVPYVIDV